MKDGDQYDVIVIGGGAAGMMAAGRAAENGKRVLLLEKNKNLGEKLKITGAGHCNITNAEENIHLLLAKYGSAAKFLFSAFAQFGVADTFEFFQKRGLPLVVKENKRAFPKTESALDVFKVLEKYLKQGQVKILANSKVDKFVIKNSRIEKIIVGEKEFVAKNYILATGGKSHPETGSTGDGFVWLKNLGHKIIKPTPTVVPLAVKDNWVKQLAGVTLPNIKINFFVDSKKSLSLKGNVLLTHFGLSGPLILNAAGRVADFLQAGEVTATIDTFPDFDLGGLDKHITGIFDQNKNKTLKNAIKLITPKGTGNVILSLIKIDPEIKINSLTKDQRKIIVNLLKALPVEITGLMGYNRAVISDGGVPLTEIEIKTMRSKLCNNLYIIGDLLHISRPSGGYSLQLCWTTGFIAGNSV
ncbi:MAG: aminoacetone oxidase family FAD-binding enzyme [Candidatus Buchananbacteria bacterium]|nr:aminoacetone oxidase family FAD-binding enzyme [Candidatus Buchananbacteria bacterium]